MDLTKYYQNEEIIAMLEGWAKDFPKLVEMRKLGESYEKRSVYMLIITNKETGPDLNKPAVWIDGNLHAAELAGSTVALALIEKLLNGYESDPQIHRLLDTSVYYVTPRVNPDGAALALAANPRRIRSSTRRYPWMEDTPGLVACDVDGNGRLLQMRIPDPNGIWKVSELNPRLMQRRKPTEQGGQYYRMLHEGKINDYDGYTISYARRPEGLDLNRNSPASWRPESEQHGAGPFPTSEPEVRNLVEFVATHPNINISLSYHTFSRVILRPKGNVPESDLDLSDMKVYRQLGQIGTEITGYRSVNTHDGFAYSPKEVDTGTFDDYMYDVNGIFGFTIELWDIVTASGVKDRSFMEWDEKHPHEEDLQILNWTEKNAPEGYVDWFPYDHPQLGKIELGGWDYMYTWCNPPHQSLPAEVESNLPYPISLAELLPHLNITTKKLIPLGNGLYKFDLVVENSGYLPTYTSQQSKKRAVVRPVRAELQLPEGAEVVNGLTLRELGFLEGRSCFDNINQAYGGEASSNRGYVNWIIKVKAGESFKVKVMSERAGSLEETIQIP